MAKKKFSTEESQTWPPPWLASTQTYLPPSETISGLTLNKAPNPRPDLSNKKKNTMDRNDFYARRDEFVRLIGFDDYYEYLSSGLWEWIRGTLNEQDDSKECFCCQSRTGLTWHHRNYAPDILVGNFANAPFQKTIVRLCRNCHYAIHRDGDIWLDADQVDDRMYFLTIKMIDNSSQGVLDVIKKYASNWRTGSDF